MNQFCGNFDTIKEHISSHLVWYILLGVVAVLGLIIGFVVGFSIGADCSIDNIPDNILLSFLKRDMSAFGLFFAEIFSSIFLLIVIWFSSCVPYTFFISFLIIGYQGFILSASCSILIVLFNIGGVLNSLLVLLPCDLIILMSSIIFSVNCIKFCLLNKSYGVSIFSNDFLCEKKRLLVIIGIALLVVIAVKSILLPWVSAVIRVSIT